MVSIGARGVGLKGLRVGVFWAMAGLVVLGGVPAVGEDVLPLRWEVAAARVGGVWEGLDAPGSVLVVRQGVHERAWAFGFADEARDTPMPSDARMRLGSVTKLYLAAVVLQLVDEGKLGLEETIDRYVDGVPNGEQITLRMLGRHTSGLDDAIRQMPFHRALAADPGRKWRTDELLAVAFEPGVRFQPGEKWAYSNTNTLLLSRVVEVVTGTGWREQVRARLLEPLGLEDTGFDEVPTVRGYRYGKPDDPVSYGGADDHVWFDATGWSASWAGAAGELTGTAADTAVFLQALFGGYLLSEAGRAEMLRFADTDGDGEGSFMYGFHCHRLGEGEGGSGYGHHGDVPGFSSSAVWLPDAETGGTAVVVLANLSAELDKWSSAIKLMDAALTVLAERDALAPVGDAAWQADVLEAFEGSRIRNGQAAVVRPDGDVEMVVYGEPGKRFRAGSVSKLLTALLVMRAVEEGVLRLDDPVERWLPGVFGEQAWAEQVTVEMLLEHTAGLAGSGPREYALQAPGLMPRAYVEAGRPFALRWRPGVHYSYSNAGYTLAGAVVESAWQSDFDTLMRREVLGPLGMMETDFDSASPVSYHGNGVTRAGPWAMPVRPAGSAVTTAGDLAKVVAMLLADGDGFLSAESVARIERGETGVVAEAGGETGVYGLGTFAYPVDGGRTLRAHWGKTEGFRATLAYTPEAGAGGAGYVLLMDTADKLELRYLRRLLNEAVTQGVDPPLSETGSVGLLPEAFEGLYLGATHDEPGRAWLMGLLGARRLTPVGDGVWVESVWMGGGTLWRRVGDRLYQAEGLSVASGAVYEDGVGRYWVDGESYRMSSALAVYGQVAVLVSGVLASVLAVVGWPVLMLFGGVRRRVWPYALAGGGVAFLGLLLGYGYHQFSGDLETVARLGRFGLITAGLTGASVLGPVAVAVAGASLVNGRKGWSSWWGFGLALGMGALGVQLAVYGVVPFWY
ncbi:MAG: serine hydrolase domain-containing protein [Planctomycetota bacterium]